MQEATPRSFSAPLEDAKVALEISDCPQSRRGVPDDPEAISQISAVSQPLSAATAAFPTAGLLGISPLVQEATPRSFSAPLEDAKVALEISDCPQSRRGVPDPAPVELLAQ